jgi:hypothetical protein
MHEQFSQYTCEMRFESLTKRTKMHGRVIHVSHHHTNLNVVTLS